MRTFVRELDSGRFEQTKTALRRVSVGDDGSVQQKYCCLGVATQVALESGMPTTGHQDDGTCEFCTRPDYGGPVPHFCSTGIWAWGTLPPQVQAWLGVEEPNPILDFGNGNQLTATFANDNAGMNFSAIATAFARTFLSDPSAWGENPYGTQP
jgi:hypothetical protein